MGLLDLQERLVNQEVEDCLESKVREVTEVNVDLQGNLAHLEKLACLDPLDHLGFLVLLDHLVQQEHQEREENLDLQEQQEDLETGEKMVDLVQEDQQGLLDPQE